MKYKVLLLHGWGGSDFPHWQSWLASELAKDYSTVSFLKFDNPDFPNKTKWKQQLKKQLNEFKPDIVICHSLANTLWFHMCNEESLAEVKKLYLVAPPSNSCDIEELSTFYPVDTPSKLYAKEAILVTSTNDPYMTQKEASELQKSLNIEHKILTDAGHINSDSGFGEWKWILQECNKQLN